MKTIITSMAIMLLAGGLPAQRPYQPFVERVCFFDYPRQIKVALHQDLWVGYDYPYCALHYAWKGGSTGGSLSNADYIVGRWQKGPHTKTQFNPDGKMYFENKDIDHYYPSYSTQEEIKNYYTQDGWNKYPTNYRPWRVRQNGQAVEVKVKYLGYLVKIDGKDRFRLNFNLILPGGKAIAMTEEPEYVGGGGVGLLRKITMTGIPEGAEVRLHCPGGNWKASGKGVMQGDEMVQTQDGESALQVQW